jgi:PKD repeat protein
MPITEYRWDFADGNQTTTSTPIVYHSFSSSGIYYVTLTVYAPGATPETDTITCKVTVVSVPVGGYSILIERDITTEPIIPCIALITILTAIFVRVKRKTNKNANKFHLLLEDRSEKCRKTEKWGFAGDISTLQAI